MFNECNGFVINVLCNSKLYIKFIVLIYVYLSLFSQNYKIVQTLKIYQLTFSCCLPALKVN